MLMSNEAITRKETVFVGFPCWWWGWWIRKAGLQTQKIKGFCLEVSRKASSMSPLNTPFQPRINCSTNSGLDIFPARNWKAWMSMFGRVRSIGSSNPKRKSP